MSRKCLHDETIKTYELKNSSKLIFCLLSYYGIMYIHMIN